MPRGEAAIPFPTIGMCRVSRPLNDHPNLDAGIVDMPGLGSVVDALAGEIGHGQIDRATARETITLDLAGQRRPAFRLDV